MATVTANKVWVSGETVTPAGLNATAAPTVLVADAEVTTSKIADAAVTNIKLASGIDAAKITTGTLPIARIADDAVTNAKLASGIDANKITTGTLPIARIADDAVTNDKLSLAANAGEIKKALNADNDPPIFACRAWVNFDGTRNAADTAASVNGGTVKIRASGNVSSVVKNSAGSFTVNFSTAMPDQNYSIALGQCTGANGSIDGRQMAIAAVNYTAGWNSGYAVIACYNEVSGSAADPAFACVSIFR
jgi:hypothetical protein